MKIYLVRRGANQVVHVTFDLEQAKQRARKGAQDSLATMTARHAAAREKDYFTPGNHQLTEHVGPGAQAKIMLNTITFVPDAGGVHWKDSWWVQAHQLMDHPLGMLGSALND